MSDILIGDSRNTHTADRAREDYTVTLAIGNDRHIKPNKSNTTWTPAFRKRRPERLAGRDASHVLHGRAGQENLHSQGNRGYPIIV